MNNLIRTTLTRGVIDVHTVGRLLTVTFPGHRVATFTCSELSRVNCIAVRTSAIEHTASTHAMPINFLSIKFVSLSLAQSSVTLPLTMSLSPICFVLTRPLPPALLLQLRSSPVHGQVEWYAVFFYKFSAENDKPIYNNSHAQTWYLLFWHGK